MNRFRTWMNLAFYILVEGGFIRASPLRASGHAFCSSDFAVWRVSYSDIKISCNGGRLASLTLTLTSSTWNQVK